MKKYSNAEICEMMDNNLFKNGDKVYVVPLSIEGQIINDEFNKRHGLYNLHSYYEWSEGFGALLGVNLKEDIWTPEQNTKWTINEKCETEEDIEFN